MRTDGSPGSLLSCEGEDQMVLEGSRVQREILFFLFSFDIEVERIYSLF